MLIKPRVEKINTVIYFVDWTLLVSAQTIHYYYYNYLYFIKTVEVRLVNMNMWLIKNCFSNVFTCFWTWEHRRRTNIGIMYFYLGLLRKQQIIYYVKLK